MRWRRELTALQLQVHVRPLRPLENRMFVPAAPVGGTERRWRWRPLCVCWRLVRKVWGR